MSRGPQDIKRAINNIITQNYTVWEQGMLSIVMSYLAFVSSVADVIMTARNICEIYHIILYLEKDPLSLSFKISF